MSEIVMGIDQSLTSTGIAIKLFNRVYFEVVSTKADKEDNLQKIKRSREIADRIVDLCTMHDVTRVQIEGLGFNAKGNATRDLSGLQFIIISSLLDAGFDTDSIELIAPTSLKKFATGNGKASKDDMFNALPDYERGEIGCYAKSKGRFDLTDAYFLSTFNRG